VERTFQLITQVAGRAGRADSPGRVVVQTYDPEHYGIACAAAQDYRAFYTREAASRRLALYPPYTVLARVVFASREAQTARKAAREAEDALRRYLVETGQEAEALQCRACEAPIAFLRGEHRWQLFVKLYFKADVEAVTRRMEQIAEAAPEGTRGELEVNPVNMI
jgi:primosomal protein N' (replication factor Y)